MYAKIRETFPFLPKTAEQPTYSGRYIVVRKLRKIRQEPAERLKSFFSLCSFEQMSFVQDFLHYHRTYLLLDCYGREACDMFSSKLQATRLREGTHEDGSTIAEIHLEGHLVLSWKTAQRKSK